MVYRFWAWQYTKRNPEFRALQTLVSETQGIFGDVSASELAAQKIAELGLERFRNMQGIILSDSEVLSEYLSHKFGFYGSNVMLNEYDSNEILKRIEAGEKLERQLSARGGTHGLRVLELRSLTEGRKALNFNGQHLEGCDAICAIDFSVPAKAIQQQLLQLLELCSQMDAMEQRQERIEVADTSALIERLSIQNRPKVSFDYQNEAPRVVGVWLWDRVYGEGGEGKPKRGAIAQAIRDLRVECDLDVLGYSISESDVFRKLLMHTKKCVGGAEVFALK